MAAAAGMAQSVNPTEIELKLLIPSADITRLRRHPLLKSLSGSKPVTRRLLSLYFDTDDLALKNRNLALRVRRSGRQWIQTVKGGGSVQGGLHQRDEWEAPVAHDRPDFTKIADPALAALFADEALRQRLRPVFVTEFSRTAWQLETAEGDQVELALDVGEIRAGERTEPISEIELELKSGNPAALFELGLELQKGLALAPENASKAERGYGLCLPAPARPAVTAVDPGLTRRMTVEEAFRAIAWCCLGQLQDNRSRFLQQGYDPEFIHQMRVAVRRLRCALGLFGFAAPAIRDEALIGELRWLAGQLGPARDWDVFLDEMLPSVMAALPGEASLDWLRRQAEAVRREKREQARTAVAGRHYNELMLRLGSWLWRKPWRSEALAAGLDMPVAMFAASMLNRRHRQLRRRGRHLAALTVEQRHALRIAAKKLRYAAEFFAGLTRGKAPKRYVQSLSRLQDVLGELNDQVVAERLLAQVGGAGSKARERAGGVIVGWNTGRSRARMAEMARAWKHFRDCRIFWEKG